MLRMLSVWVMVAQAAVVPGPRRPGAVRPGRGEGQRAEGLADARAMLDEVLKADPRSKGALLQKASALEAYAEHVETTASRRKPLQAEADALRERAFGVR